MMFTNSLNQIVMTLELGIPALFFPAISLTMLAYNARFLTIAGLIRSLHKEYQESHDLDVKQQIEVLSKRLHLIRSTQGFAILSFICCIVAMLLIFLEINAVANILFLLGLGAMLTSLIILFIEIQVSMSALKIRLKDMEE